MRTEIATFGALWQTAWDQYKKRALPLIAVMLISSVVIGSLLLALALTAVLGGAVLAHFTDERTAALLLMLLVSLLLILAIILTFWAYTTLIALVVDGDLGIIESFQAGWRALWPMAWVQTLAPAILLAGLALGILPGILFGVWFSFCGYILLAEDRRGLDALLASREYVRGHWWNTFGKQLLLWLISGAASMIPFVGQIISLLFTPFFMLFMLAIYHNLKVVHGEVRVDAGPGARVFWWCLAALGLLLPLAALGAGLYALLTGDQQWLSIPETMHGTWL